MQIVVEIPEEWFNRLQDAWGWALAENVREAIKSGTILPKGHGRLIDADKLESCTVYYAYAPRGFEELLMRYADLQDAPTIIEADKEESEVDE